MTSNETLLAEERDELLRLQGYTVERPLGEGRFGNVVLARDNNTGLNVAIKITLVTPFDVKAVEYIEQEIKALQLLNHPYVVKLYDVLRIPVRFPNQRADGYTLYGLVLEYAEHGNLFQYIVKRSRLSEDEARRVMKQVILAVEACHNKSLAHRDIKAENIFVDSNDNVLLGDFGLSTFYRSDCALWQSCGSLDYAAPEIVRSGSYIGPEIDVWSLGVLLYGCMCGFLPFKRPSREAIGDAIKRGLFTALPAHVPEGPRRLIERMLTVDQDKRATIRDIKNDPWFAVGGWALAEDDQIESADACPAFDADATAMDLSRGSGSTAIGQPDGESAEEEVATTAPAPVDLKEEERWRAENKKLVRYLKMRNNKQRITKEGKWQRRRTMDFDQGAGFLPMQQAPAAIAPSPLAPVVRWS